MCADDVRAISARPYPADSAQKLTESGPGLYELVQWWVQRKQARAFGRASQERRVEPRLAPVLASRRRRVGPGTYCSPRHYMPLLPPALASDPTPSPFTFNPRLCSCPCSRPLADTVLLATS